MSAKRLRVLLIEDSKSDLLLIIREIRRGGYEVEYQQVETMQELETSLNKNWNIILSDYSLPSLEAPAVLKLIREQKKLDTPVIVVSGTISEDVAVQVMKSGANDYFNKDKLQRLVPAIERELEQLEHYRQGQKAQERFFKIFMTSPVGIALVRYTDGRMIDLNPRLIEMMGYQREEIIGKTGDDLNLWVNPDHRVQFQQMVQNVEIIKSVEVIWRTATGEEIDVLLSSDVIGLDDELCILTYVHDITEQKKRQNEILETKNLLEKTFASLNEAVFIADPITRTFQMCNAAVFDIFGYQPEELIGQRVEILFSDSNVVENLNSIGRPMIEKGDTLQIEYPMRHKTGKTIYTDLTVTSLYEDKGFEAGVVCVIRNITQKKLAEARVKRSNKIVQLLRDVAMASNEADSINFIVQFVIDKLCTHTGWDIGHAYLFADTEDLRIASTSIWHIDDNDQYEEFREFTDTRHDLMEKGLIHKVLDTKQTQQIKDIRQSSELVRSDIAKQCGLQAAYAFPILASDSVVGVFEFFSQRLPDETTEDLLGVIMQVGTQVGRVVERDRAKMSLHESEVRYRSLFDLSRNAVYIQNLDGIFIDANPAALNLLGVEKTEITRLSLQSLVIPEQLQRAVQIFRETLMFGYQREVAEFTLQCKDGSLIDVETTASVIYKDGEPWAVQGIVHDITARNQAHAQEQARRILAEALHHTVSALFDGELDLNEMFERILAYASGLIPCDAATLMLVDSDVARAVHCIGYNEHEISEILKVRMEIDQVPNLREMAQTKRPVLISDTRTFADWRSDEISPLKNIRGYLGSPIFVSEQLCGFINLDNRLPNQFTSEHAEQLEMLTDQVAITIHNAELYQKINRYTKRLEVLHEIDQSILAISDSKTIAQMVLKQLKSLISFDSAVVVNLDEKQEYATFLAIEGNANTSWQLGDSILTENHPALEHLKHNQPYIVNDTKSFSESTFSLEQQVSKVGVQSYIAFPLISRDLLIGVLVAMSDSAYTFSPETIDIVSEVTAQLAIAIEKANLLELEQKRNTEFVVLQMASLQLTANLNDMELVLNTILDYAIFLVQADDAHIFFYDGAKLEFGAAFWDGKRQTHPYAEPSPTGLTYTVAQTGTRVVVPDMREHPLYQNRQWEGAIIGLPLIVNDKLNGVMSVAFDRPHQFDDQEIRVLELLADQATFAIHNVQLYQQIQQYADELELRVEERTAELQRQKDLMETILSNNSDAILLLAADGTIIQANRAFCSMFACVNETINGRNFSDVARIEQTTVLEQALQDVIDKQRYQRIELLASLAEGHQIEVDVILSPVESNGNVQSEIVCSLRDITIQKQIELGLRNALAKEQELNQLKSKFTSIVSHEFRTPLAVINSSAEMLKTYHERLTEEKRLAYLERIREKVRSLTRLMEDVLILSRSETVGFNFEPKPTDLVALCENIIGEVQIGYSKDNVIRFIHQNMTNPQFDIDPELTSHILHNLLSNAIKYSPEGGKVTLDLAYSEQTLTIMVQDEGIGMPKEYQEKLFQPFQRANNVGTIQGTGIGLTIIKRAVDAHRGKIHCISEEGQGTTFVVSIPILTGRNN